MKPHLAEMLLDINYHGATDQFRTTHPFSEDIESTQAILFNPKYNKFKKIDAYRRWLVTGQPCVFGRAAARTKSVFICLLEEGEILRMKKGDDDLRDTIQDHRQVWKRYALDEPFSSFLVVLVSNRLVNKEPGDKLKEISRRLLELYMQVDSIPDNTILPQREYVFLRKIKKGSETKLLKFATLPNVFCTQADGRWWHDHRTPGGIMITSNALGHYVLTRNREGAMGEKEKTQALDNAMRTIDNAFCNDKRRRGLAHCPATRLVRRAEGEVTPIRESSEFHKYSPTHYEGYFHTDHLVPSVFFTKDRDPKELKLYEDLSFEYIFDPAGDPDDHRELMTGTEATWYDVKRNMERLPDYVDPEKTNSLTGAQRGRLVRWLEGRLKERLVP
jgi:hypothetical protein